MMYYLLLFARMLFRFATISTALVFASHFGFVEAQVYRETTYDYRSSDGLPETITIHNADGADATTSFVWDSAGNLEGVTDPEGRTVTAEYRDDRRLRNVTTAPGSNRQMHTRYRYDAAGRLNHVDASMDGSVSPTSWATTTVSYTPTGRVQAIEDPDGDTQSFSYDALGRVRRTWDGEQRSSLTVYWPDGLIWNLFEAYGSDEQTKVAQQYYNALGERRLLRPANGLGSNPGVGAASGDFDTRWTFDAFGRVDGVSFPSPADAIAQPTESYSYDDNGNMTSRTTRAGDVLSMLYDDSGRLEQKTTPEGTTVTTYNLAGQPDTITRPDPHGAGVWQLEYEYDFAGRVKSETTTTPEGIIRTVSYEYDGAGNRTRITWPDGFYVDYVYDDANRLFRVIPQGSSYAFAQYDYDELGRLWRYVTRNSQGSIRARMIAGYEADNDLTFQRYIFGNAPNVRFDYDHDASGYLVSREASLPAWRWSPATTTEDYEAANYEVNGLDQYTAVAGVSYSYDLNGNLTSDGLRTFTYTAENQLLTATTLSGGTAQYSYGPVARRVRKSVDGVGTDFLHAGNMEIAEYDTATGELLRRYVPGLGVDQRVVAIECGVSSVCEPGGAGVETRYYLTDQQGNVLAVTNEDGSIHQQFFYTPFGVELVGDASGNPFRYTGRRFDPETGLYYYRARYYDPDLGRFLQVDPVGYADQWNLYAYVGNNPVNTTDPTGMYGDPRECETFKCDEDHWEDFTLSSAQSGGAGQPSSPPQLPENAPPGPANDNTPSANDNQRTLSGGRFRLRGLSLLGAFVSVAEQERLRREGYVPVWRYSGGRATLMGRPDSSFWMGENPLAMTKYDIRQRWAILPEWGNTMEYLVIGYADPAYIIDSGPASGETSIGGMYFEGGGLEYEIMDPNVAVHVLYAGPAPNRE
jgi:RHS repeat-associated protein